MTLRGRLTLTALAAFVGGVCVTLLAGDPAPPQPAVSETPVAARTGTGDPEALELPAELIEALPSRRDGLVRVAAGTASPGPLFVAEHALPPGWIGRAPGPLAVEYAFDAELTRLVEQVLQRARVARGHAIVLDPRTGRLLAYVSTDPESFPPQAAYPAASLVKVITAAAVLHHAPEAAQRPCRYSGNPYRLRASQVHRPSRGIEISLERALAASNNHCFAQLAVESLGTERMVDAIARFGWLEAPAPGHAAGQIGAVESEFDLGRLGCGLDGCRITPLHAAQLMGALVHGMRVEPWWVHRVLDASGRELWSHQPAPWRRVMTQELADELRGMLVRTTTRGTAKRAFRDRRGRPLLGAVAVAGKTGNLSGRTEAEPEAAGRGDRGRFEWFAGLAPADAPSVVVAVVQMHGDLWWQSSSWIGAQILEQIFCERGRCDAALAARFTGEVQREVAPLFLSETGR